MVSDRIDSFISHMVQIKPNTKPFTQTAWLNFISHMVQIKRAFRDNNIGGFYRLYIPYGSNKTRLQSLCLLVISALYPIWFK